MNVGPGGGNPETRVKSSAGDSRGGGNPEMDVKSFEAESRVWPRLAAFGRVWPPLAALAWQKAHLPGKGLTCQAKGALAL